MENDAYRPAFFEVYAAEHLSTALRPALRFVLEVISVRYPALVRIAAWSDEIFTGLLLILETSQLRKDSAMLAESFYSLRRSPVLSFHEKDLSPSPLSTRQIFLSVILSVVMPHVKARLDMWYSNATGGAAAELFGGEMVPLAAVEGDQTNAFQSEHSSTSHLAQPSSSLPMGILSRALGEMQRIIQVVTQFSKGPAFRRLVLKWYPRISSVCEGINLLYNVTYLFGHTKHFTLSLAVQRLVLRRASTSELLQTVSDQKSFFPAGRKTMDLSRIIAVASERMLAMFKAGFFASIFAFRFLQYYYAAEASMPREPGPIISAPERLLPAPGVDQSIALCPGLCPICHKPRVSPTACVTSGYVFCYLCIVRHVQQTQKCPVTLAPTLIDDLMRVYDDARAS